MTGKPGTLNLEAWDAGFLMLVDDAQYKYLVTSDGDPFAYFLNPSVYGSGAAFVRYDPTGAGSWVAEDFPDTQYLDDRYGVGATYLSDLYGRPPFGANLPGVFIQLNTAGTAVLDDVVQSLKLTKAYTTGTILPYLIVKVYEQRLASYDYYAYLGQSLDTYDADFFDTYAGGSLTALDNPLALTKDQLMDLLVTELVASLNTGALGTAYTNFTGLDLVAEADEKEIYLSNMARFDGVEVKGERYGDITTGHLGLPNIVVPGLTRVVGNEYYGLKGMRGVYTVFAPEKFNDLAVVVEDTIAALGTTMSLTFDAGELEKLAGLKYRWNDFFRGQDQEIKVRIGGTDADPVFKTMRANVFISAIGSQLVAPVVTLEDPQDPGELLTVVGQGINLSDTYSYVDETFHTAQPLAQRFTTGPYGARGWVDEDGNVHYLNDGYSV